MDTVNVACKKDSDLNIQIKKAFENLINVDNSVALSLAKYMDILMKKWIKGMSDEGIEHISTEAIGLFRLLTDKDVFESFYRAGLSRRLLNA